jgi:hypothetical protein
MGAGKTGMVKTMKLQSDLVGRLFSSSLKQRWFMFLGVMLVALLCTTAYGQNTAAGFKGYMFFGLESSSPADHEWGGFHYCNIHQIVVPEASQTMQSGLFHTWYWPSALREHPNYDRDTWGYHTMEGGAGYKSYLRFKNSASPQKFTMGGVSGGFGDFSNGPGVGNPGFNNSNTSSLKWEYTTGRYGAAVLSNRLLFPFDGIGFKEGTNNKMLGYGYYPLPLTEPKTTTEGEDSPTGNHCWTLFFNTENFRGPVAFHTPHHWAKYSLGNLNTRGTTFDNSTLRENSTYQREASKSAGAQWTDPDTGDIYYRALQVTMPVDDDNIGRMGSTVMNVDSTMWDNMTDWFAGGDPAATDFDAPGAIHTRAATSGSLSASIDGVNISGETAFMKRVSDPADSSAIAFEYSGDLIERIEGADLMKLPEYYVLRSGETYAVAIAESDVPAASGLQARNTAADYSDLYNFTNSETDPIFSPLHPDYAYSDPVVDAWKSPGPTAGPYTADLDDGSTVIYYWYKFNEQPSILNSDMDEAERALIQERVELIHQSWGKDDQYFPDPVQERASLDPGLIVTPPPGLEIGYVPVCVHQQFIGEALPAYPVIDKIKNALPYSESFESGVSDWNPATISDYDWQINQGATSSSDAGPDSASDGDYYLYAEGDDGSSGESAMAKATFDFSTVNDATLTFDYHMAGADIDYLAVDVLAGSSWTQDVWIRTGPQHAASDEPWLNATVDLSAYAGNSEVSIRFRTALLDGNNADPAIDNISLTGDPKNNPPEADAISTTLYENSSVAIVLSGSDAEGSNLTYAVASQPANGTLGGTTPNLTYTPNPDFHGADSFAFTANDGTDNSAESTVSIQVIPLAGLVADWPMNTGYNTTVIDATGHGFDGIMSGAIWSGSGFDDRALEFNGGSSTVALPASAFESISNEVTISMWAYGADNQPLGDSIFHAENAAGDRVLNVHLPWSNGSVYWDAGFDTDYDRIFKAAVTNEYKGGWNHWVFTKDAAAGEMAIYLNGEPWHSDTGMTRSMDGITAAALGSQIDGGYYSGTIDEVRLYNTSLDAAAVSALHAAYLDAVVPEWPEGSIAGVNFEDANDVEFDAAPDDHDPDDGISVSAGWTFVGDATGVSVDYTANAAGATSGSYVAKIGQGTKYVYTMPSVTPADYFSWTITIPSNVVLNLSEITFDLRQGTDNASNTRWAMFNTSLDGGPGGASLWGVEVPPLRGEGWANAVVDLSEALYQGLTDTTVTFYWYCESTGCDIDTIVVKGDVVEVEDTEPPTPNPMVWASPPTAESTNSITMTASDASDPSDVEYYFTCTVGGGHDSGWQDSPAYTDTGLAAETTYTYTVTARDTSANQNTTAASAEASATTPALPVEVSAIIYSETFDGDGTSGLDGVAPTIGANAWDAKSDFINNNGTVNGGGANSAWAGAALLPFEPETNQVYTLSVDLLHTGNNPTDLSTLKYLALGFTRDGINDALVDTSNRFPDRFGVAWFQYGGSGAVNTWAGLKDANAIANTATYVEGTNINLKVLIDTTGDGTSFTADFLIDDESIVGGPQTIALAVDLINYVGLGSYGTRNGDSPVGSVVDNFELSVGVESEVPDGIGDITMGRSGSALGFSWYGEAGLTYGLEVTADLTSGNWQTVTNLVGANELITLTDEMDQTNAFYRVYISD